MTGDPNTFGEPLGAWIAAHLVLMALAVEAWPATRWVGAAGAAMRSSTRRGRSCASELGYTPLADCRDEPAGLVRVAPSAPESGSVGVRGRRHAVHEGCRFGIRSDNHPDMGTAPARERHTLPQVQIVPDRRNVTIASPNIDRRAWTVPPARGSVQGIDLAHLDPNDPDDGTS